MFVRYLVGLIPIVHFVVIESKDSITYRFRRSGIFSSVYGVMDEKKLLCASI